MYNKERVREGAEKWERERLDREKAEREQAEKEQKEYMYKETVAERMNLTVEEIVSGCFF